MSDWTESGIQNYFRWPPTSQPYHVHNRMATPFAAFTYIRLLRLHGDLLRLLINYSRFHPLLTVPQPACLRKIIIPRQGPTGGRAVAEGAFINFIEKCVRRLWNLNLSKSSSFIHPSVRSSCSVRVLLRWSWVTAAQTNVTVLVHPSACLPQMNYGSAKCNIRSSVVRS